MRYRDHFIVADYIWYDELKRRFPNADLKAVNYIGEEIAEDGSTLTVVDVVFEEPPEEIVFTCSFKI